MGNKLKILVRMSLTEKSWATRYQRIVIMISYLILMTKLAKAKAQELWTEIADSMAIEQALDSPRYELHQTVPYFHITEYPV